MARRRPRHPDLSARERRGVALRPPRKVRKLHPMSTTEQFTIGSAVVCCDGGDSELRRVVVDPVARTVTHLVVGPRRRQGADRLVPVDLVASAAQDIRLRCTTAEFDALEHSDETHFLPRAPASLGYAEDQILSWPYFNLGGGVSGIGLGTRTGSQSIVRDRVPVGEVEVRRGEHVRATDGPIGRVQGLIVDASNHHVTHVLLDEGHLWGQHSIAIPIGAVTGIEHGVRLSLTKDEIRELARVDATTEGTIEAPAPAPKTGDATGVQHVQRIVVGVDGSDGSAAALSWALMEARLRHATLHAVLAWRYHPSWTGEGTGSMFPLAYTLPGAVPLVLGEYGEVHEGTTLAPPRDTAQSTEADRAAMARRMLDEAISQAVERDGQRWQGAVEITRRVVEGHGAQVLLDEVRDSDLLVVGTRGHGGFVGALLGSVSHHVVSQARCPVVVVPRPPSRD
ncbi:MAG: universal stress protein [Jatrophihabitantaceae bacterium]